MCVCVRIHTHTLSPASKIEKTQVNTSISPSVKNNPPRQATSVLHRPLEPTHPRPPIRMNKLRIHERIWTSCRLSRRYVRWCQKCLWDVHTCMHWCLGHLLSAHHALRKNTHTPAQARPCDSAATSSPCKQLQPISQLELCPRNRQNPRQPMAQSQLRRHTDIIWSSVMVRGPSSFSMVRIQSLATEPIHHKFLFPPLFLPSRGFHHCTRGV